MKITVFNEPSHHVIHYEKWPIDCLIRYLDKKQRLLLMAIAPKIILSIDSINTTKSGRSALLLQLDDLFTSSVNRLVIQIARQDQNLVPYLNHLIVAIERELPVNIGLFSVVYDCINQLKQDHEIQRKIFGLIKMVARNIRVDDRAALYPHLFSAIQLFEKELFHILDLQRKILFPKICRITSRY